jgi:hypothetical protein
MLQLSEVHNQESSELDYGVRSNFLLSMDQDQKIRVFDLTTRASRELHRWAARFPLIRRVRVWPLCLSVAAAAPFASVSALVSMARMSLWVFTIDDLFDEEMVPFAELRRRVVRYKAVLAGTSVEAKRERDTLVLALQDIRDDLSSYALWPTLHDEWAEAVRRTLDAMMQEHEWRMLYRERSGEAAFPSYDAYLSHGRYSIGVAAHIWTTLIAISDPSSREHLAQLRELEQTASLCIRLSNDLQSHAKEISEGKINSIVIRQREAIAAGYPPEEALAIACETNRQEILRGLQRCGELQEQVRTETGHPERAIADIARFVCDFYVHHDYHTFAQRPPTATGALGVRL